MTLPKLAFTTWASWPPLWPSPAPVMSRFKIGYQEGLDLLGRQAAGLGASHAVIALNFVPGDLRRDGWPHPLTMPGRPGVIITLWRAHFNADGQPVRALLRFPCTRYLYWVDNIIAVARAVESLARLNEYHLTEPWAQFRPFEIGWYPPSPDLTWSCGWEAPLIPREEVPPPPPPPGSGAGLRAGEIESARAVLMAHSLRCLAPAPTPAELQEAYRAGCRRVHPDVPVTGSHAAFVAMGQAYHVLLEAFS